MLASGWFWLVAAVGLGIAETLLPGFILLGFAIGAAVTGVLVFTGILSSLGWTLLVFAIASGLGWLALRRFFSPPGQRPKIWKADINDN